MDKQILKCLLVYDFYNTNRSRLRSALFEDEIKDLYQVIEKAHDRYSRDINGDELLALWRDAHPVSTKAQIGEIRNLIEAIEHSGDLDQEIAHDLIEGLWKRSIGRDLANLAIAVSEGDDEALLRMEELISRSRDGYLPDDFGEDTTHDIHQLLEANQGKCEFRFNLPSLANHLPGIGRGTFSLIFAPPETGKTAAAVSFIAGPGGFCEQGFRVAYIGNEEKTSRTMLRAIQAASGMTEIEIINDPEEASRRFRKVSEKLHMKDAQQWDLMKLGAYVEKVKPDIVVIDQLDKIVSGKASMPTHERLQQLYTDAREFAKKYDVGLIGVGQASADAVGQTRIGADQMQNSKIGKQSELDVILGIGKYPDKDDENCTRFITVSKNKLSGWHGTIVCQLEPSISRYMD